MKEFCGKWVEGACLKCGEAVPDFAGWWHPHAGGEPGLVILVHAPLTGEGRAAVEAEAARLRTDAAYRRAEESRWMESFGAKAG